MGTILIADDDDVIRGLVAHKLRASGHDVIETRTGTEAIAAASEHRPDVAVLDWMMPGHNGLEVAEALRTHESVPGIIMLTARAQEADVERGFAAGADDYLVKPFSPRELLVRVEAALSRRRAP